MCSFPVFLLGEGMANFIEGGGRGHQQFYRGGGTVCAHIGHRE